MYFKRDARPKLPVDFRGLSEEEVKAAVKALTYAEVDQMVKACAAARSCRRKSFTTAASTADAGGRGRAPQATGAASAST